MALLSGPSEPGGPGGLRMLRGAEAVLARHTRALPQPDQLCGPFAASLALAALPGPPVGVTELAVDAGTRVLTGDHAQWRPAGAPLVTTGWDELPTTEDPGASGTDARGLVAGLASVRPDVAVVPAEGGAGDVVALLVALAQGRHRVGVLANLRTGPVAPAGVDWDVGHFVVLWGVDPDAGPHGSVVVADTYAELGAPGWPRGCRPVDGAALAAALDGRGLLLLASDGGATHRSLPGLVASYGFGDEVWST